MLLLEPFQTCSFSFIIGNLFLLFSSNIFSFFFFFWSPYFLDVSLLPLFGRLFIYLFWAVPPGLQDLDSLTSDQNLGPLQWMQSPNHWTTRQFPWCIYIFLKSSIYLIFFVLDFGTVYQSNFQIHQFIFSVESILLFIPLL